MVSPAVGYAAAALGFLAVNGNGPVTVKKLAIHTGAPEQYLSKIVQRLTKKGYFVATKGRGGGVVPGVDPRKVTLFDLCAAIEDDILHPQCALGVARCSDRRNCPAHALQVAVREQQLKFLRNTTVEQIGQYNAKQLTARSRTGRTAPRVKEEQR